MIAYKPATIRSWAMLGSRGTFGMALLELAQENESIVALSGDLCKSSGLDRFSTTFPNRFINAGIAEQNMVGAAAGLAASGFIPFVTSFPNFLTLRAAEQVRLNLGYMQENVKLVGRASGLATGMFGATHHGIEDLALLRSVSNINIFSPADCTATVKMTQAALAHNGPVYLRLTGGMRAPIVYKEDFELIPGKAISLREGTDIAIVATGSMVHTALVTADLLSDHGINAAVFNISSRFFFRAAADLTDHRQLRLGIPQGYPHSGDYAWMLEQSGLTAEQVTARIMSTL